MDRATMFADPLPDPKTVSTFWAAECKALATGLGCVALVHLRESNPCVIAFVFKEVAQPGPAHVEGGLGVPRLDLPLGRDISDEDRTGMVDDGAGIFVKRILAPAGDLGVDGAELALTSTPVRFSELGFKVAIKAALIKVGCVVCRGHGFKAKVNTHDLGAICGLRLDLADNIAVPAATGILREVARGNLAFDLAMLPDAEGVTAQGEDAAPADIDVLVGKRHPSKGALGPLARAPAQTGLAMFAPPDDERLDHLLNDLGGQAELAARAFGQVAQLFFRGPAGPAFKRSFADLVAVVPNRVDLVAERNKVLAAARVLDTKAEGLVELHLRFGFHWSKAWRPTALVSSWSMELRSARHVVLMLRPHVVFTTKRRGKVLSNEPLQRLETILRDVCADCEVEL